MKTISLAISLLFLSKFCYALDSMRIRIRTELPPKITTVGGGAQYYADAVGYKLVLNTPESRKIASEMLSPMAAVNAVRPLEEAILTLLREDCLLIIDAKNKLFSFKTKNSALPKKKKKPVNINREVNGLKRVATKTVARKADQYKLSKPVRFIRFKNESDLSFDDKALLKFIESTSSDSSILVIGHSHGMSNVGVADLATRRAETIRDYLKDNGFKSVQTMASWGDAGVTNKSPNCGVSLYVLGNRATGPMK
jgi:hypothetical protein